MLADLNLASLSVDHQAEVQQLRGLVRSAQEDWRGAEQALEAAIQLRPDQPQAYLGLIQMHVRAGEHTSAIDVLERLAAINPTRTQTWFALLGGLAQSGDWPRFQRLSERMLDANPGHLILHNLAARLNLEAGRYAYAFLVYQAIADRGTDFDRSQFKALATLEALA